MVGIVLISHSAALASGTAELAGQIAGDVRLVPVGGTDDGRLGTDAERIAKAVVAADQGDGVLLIPDLGSAVLTAKSVLAELEQQVHIADAPFVEGAVAAAVAAAAGLDLAAVAGAAEEARHVGKL
jgi:PTS hybrid protein